MVAIVRIERKSYFPFICIMKNKTQANYIKTFTFINENIGKMKIHIIKSDMEKGLCGAIEQCIEFQFHGICRFHIAQEIRSIFRQFKPISKLMFRKNREQENSVNEHLVQTSFQSLKSLCLLQPAFKNQIIHQLKKRNTSCNALIKDDIFEGMFRNLKFSLYS